MLPTKPRVVDSIAWLGGRQQLKADVLGKALNTYFDGGIEVKGNDIHIKASPVVKGEAPVKVYFSGAKDAVIEDHKFSLVVRSPACDAGVTFERADGTDILAHAIRDVDGLLAVLDEFWPEKK